MKSDPKKVARMIEDIGHANEFLVYDFVKQIASGQRTANETEERILGRILDDMIQWALDDRDILPSDLEAWRTNYLSPESKRQRALAKLTDEDKEVLGL